MRLYWSYLKRVLAEALSVGAMLAGVIFFLLLIAILPFPNQLTQMIVAILPVVLGIVALIFFESFFKRIKNVIKKYQKLFFLFCFFCLSLIFYFFIKHTSQGEQQLLYFLLGIVGIYLSIMTVITYMIPVTRLIYKSRGYLKMATPAQKSDLENLLAQNAPPLLPRQAIFGRDYLIFLPDIIIAKEEIVTCKTAGIKERSYRTGRSRYSKRITYYLVKVTLTNGKNKTIEFTSAKDARGMVKWWRKTKGK